MNKFTDPSSQAGRWYYPSTIVTAVAYQHQMCTEIVKTLLILSHMYTVVQYFIRYKYNTK